MPSDCPERRMWVLLGLPLHGNRLAKTLIITG